MVNNLAPIPIPCTSAVYIDYILKTKKDTVLSETPSSDVPYCAK